MKRVQEFTLVDWGTSNLRVWITDAEGRLHKQAMSPIGADRLLSGQFYDVLKNILQEIGGAPGIGGKYPVVICGMAGARNGWVEAGYVSVPASCYEVLASPAHIETDDLDVYILPGLAVQDKRTPDVMRGEETQLLGFHIQNPDFSGLICLPGTHGKWVFMDRGSVTSFRTAMTGELFALLSRQSVIRHVVGDESLFSPDDAGFKAGILEGYNHPEQILFDLFSVRARGLLFSAQGAAASSRLSGLLIGAEISGILKNNQHLKRHVLIATGRISILYQKAFEYLGREIECFDADLLVQEGLRVAAEKIFDIKREGLQ